MLAPRAIVAALLLALGAGAAALADDVSIAPSRLPRIGAVDPRFQSYNIEMVEVTGGRFWKPYEPGASLAGKGLHAERPPIDLTNARLRKLAAALGPVYLRISGTWANATWFADTDTATLAPPGFTGVLTRGQWRGVIDFAGAVDARLVTSFAISAGTRDAEGAWTPDQAKALIVFTREAGGRIAAVEFMNEPDLPDLGRAAPGYDTAAYARDHERFLAFMRRESPDTLVLGPGTAGQSVASEPLARAVGADVDVFSYHHYGVLSERCTGAPNPLDPLSGEWLARSADAFAFHARLRDRFAADKPIWLTETADAACGGNRSAVTFADTFRYLDQLGRLAKAGAQVVMHNTLAASDYGLLGDKDFTPRPNYWGALLWRRLMGDIVLDAHTPAQSGLYVYAHCQRGVPGGVALLVISTDRGRHHSLTLAAPARRYTLDAATLQDTTVQLNGRPMILGADDAMPDLASIAEKGGVIAIPPATITFVAVPDAANAACP